MNELNLKLAGCTYKQRPNIFIDGKEVKYNKDDFGNLVVNYKTEKDSVEVAICKYLEINSKLWFLMSIVFFFVSIFGIFDARYDKKCVVIDCKYNIKLKEKTDIKFTLCDVSKNDLNNQGRGVVWEGDCQCEQIKNIGYTDQKARKRLKLMFWIKFLLWIALIVGVILAFAL